MFGVLLAAFGFAVLYVVVQADRSSKRESLLAIILGGYLLRLILQTFVRDLPLFSHGVGGTDNETYELLGQLLSIIWNNTGYHFVTRDEFHQLGRNTLPGNVFGTVMWINGGPTRLGCTAVVALAACLTFYNLYRLAVELGADEKFAFTVLALTLFGPALLMYTSDTYKDAFVVLFTTGAVASAFRLARKFSVIHLLIGYVCLVALWQVRFYMVFVAAGPLVVGLTGLTSKSAWRGFFVAGLLVAAGTLAGTYTGALGEATDSAEAAFTHGSAEANRLENAEGGSGVVFDDGGRPFGAFVPKLAYTLFAPFPRQGGSIALQIGKLDAIIWYFLVYRAFIAGRRLLRENSSLLLMFLVFLVPTTVAYATSMANIGLIVRQRLPIVLIGALLATLSEPKRVLATEDELERATAPASPLRAFPHRRS